MGADELAALLGRTMQTEKLRQPTIVSAGLRELAEQADEAAPRWGPAYSEALQWRLTAPAAEDERPLGSRSVVRATRRLAPDSMAGLARRTLRLRDGGEPREMLDMLGGALEWLKPEGAAAA